MRVHFGDSFLTGQGLNWATSWKALTGAALDLDFVKNRNNQTLGANLATNGTFDADIAGWTTYGISGGNAAGVVWDATGKISITGTGTGFTGAYQAIATVVGAVYEAVAVVAGAALNFTVSTGINGQGTVLATNATTGTITHRFTAVGTTTYLALYRTGAVTATGDTVTVREVSPPLSRLLTTARASAGLAQHADGRWESFAAGVPRITSKGLLVEEARTNSIRNNSMQGAVLNGALPTNWSIGNPSGLTTTVVGLGTELGLDTIDLRLAGTCTAGNPLFVEFDATSMAAASGTAATVSMFLKRVAGTLPASVQLDVVQRDVSDAYLGDQLTGIAVTDALLRLAAAGANANASTTQVRGRLVLNVILNQVYDFTIRIAQPQLELGAFATSPIRTTGSAATRAAETVNLVTLPASLATATTEHSLFAQAQPNVPAGATVGNQTWVQLDDSAGASSNRTNLYRDTVGAPAVLESSGGATPFGYNAGSLAANITHRTAGGFKGTDAAFVANGSKLAGTTSGAAIPLTLNTLRLGNNSGATNGSTYLERIAVFASRLSDANLIRLTLGQDVDTGDWALAGASLDMDFASDRYLGQHKNQLTVSRASVGMADDSAGVWTSFANNVPRITNKGLLVEESRTNSIRNNTMQGAVAGLPGSGGAGPTHWLLPAVSGTVTRTIVGTGVSAHGLDYIDIRFQATAGGYSDITFENTSPPTVAQGQTWTLSAFVRIVAGSTENISSINLILYGSPGFNDNGSAVMLPTLSGSIQRYSATVTFAQVGTTAASPRLSITPSGAGPMDITLRISVPQLEQGAFATSPIRTTGSAATRQLDVVTLASLGPWFNAAAGSLYAEGMSYDSDAAHTLQTLLSFDDTTGNERIQIRRSGTSYGSVVVDGGVVQANPGVISIFPLNTYAKTALAYAPDDFAAIAGAATPVTDALGTLPTVTTMRLGCSVAGSAPLNGYLKRAAYIPSRVSNATLQALTT